MKNGIQLLCYFCFLALLSCDPVEIPEPREDGIAFGLEGTVDGTPLSLSLDGPDQVMATHAVFIPNDSMWTFVGQLGAPDSIKGSSLTLAFRHPLRGLNDIPDIAPLFDTLDWDFFHDEGREITLHPVDIEVLAPPSTGIERIYSPDVSGQWEFRRVGTLNLRERKKIQLCVEYQNGQGLPGRFCSPLTPGNMSQVPVLNWNVERQTNDSAYLKAQITPSSPIGNIEYRWQESNWTDQPLFSTRRPQTIKVESRHPAIGSLVHEKQLVQSNSGKFQTYGNDIQIIADWQPPRTVINRRQPGSFIVRYRDAQGRNWRWKPGAPGEFEILEHRAHAVNELGQPTRALRIRLSCTLENFFGDTIQIENLEGWFAIGLPQD